MTRKALTRTEIILICERQAGVPILCGCGCGSPLDPEGEGVIDEHVMPRKLTALGHETERDVIANRGLWRKPCAVAKTADDLARIAKARAQGGETGQRKRREARGGSSIKGGGFQAPPEGYRHQWAKRPFRKSPETPHDH